MQDTATIDVNGRRYDAVTGVVLGPSSAPTVQSTGRNIDGFFRARTLTAPRATTSPTDGDTIASPASVTVLPTAPTIQDIAGKSPALEPKRIGIARNINHAKAHTPQAAKTRVIEVSHPAARSQSLEVRRETPNHVKARVPQHSRTLRRDAVPAPQLSTHNALSPKATLQHKLPSAIVPKQAITEVNPDRLARAYSTPRSPLVTHHARQLHSTIPVFAPVAVQPLSMPGDPPVPGTGDAPVAPPPQPTNKPNDLFEHAIANASNYVDMKSHTATYKKHARIHLASMTVGIFVLVVAGAFAIYRTSPSLQLKVASYRSGVNSTIPDMTGTGFTYNGASVNGNRLVFGLASQGKSYQVAQTTTNMSDAELIETIGSTYASGNPQYTTVLAGNTMVYRFSNTTATWISGGKWYSLSGDAALTNKQVQAIVQHLY